MIQTRPTTITRPTGALRALRVALLAVTSAPLFAQSPAQPVLSILNEGPAVYIEWTESDNADGYTLFYAPYPDAEEIYSIDMGAQRSIAGLLQENGLAFYAAVKARNALASSDYSNIETFSVDIDNVFYPPANTLTVCRYIEPIASTALACEIKDFENYGYGKLDEYVVTNRDIIFSDVPARRAALQTLSQSELEQLCSYGSHLSPGSYASHTVEPLFNYTTDTPGSFSDMFATMVYGRAYYVFVGDENAGGMVARSLRSWADANSLLDISHSDQGDGGPSLNLRIMFQTLVLGWHAVRDAAFVSDDDRQEIDRYLTALATNLTFMVGESYGEDGPNLSDSTNPAWSQDSGLMSYGIAFANDYYFQRGIRRFFAILDGMIRPDGSIWYASQRGGSALGYSIYGVGLLLRIAEMGAMQGYNLYDVQVNGITLHDIMNFHIAILEDNSLLFPYTEPQADGFTGGEEAVNWNNQLWAFSYEPEGGVAVYADLEIYKSRYPESAWTQRFNVLWPEDAYPLLTEGALLHSCEFRPVLH